MHIYLIGFRGSGKSTVGACLANLLSYPFLDSDRVIEADGKSIRTIFDEVGEAGFRDKEHQVIKQISALNEPHVVGLGGGAILREDNRQILRDTGVCAWLQGKPESLYSRISADRSSDASRPNLTQSGGYNEVVDMLAQREPLYREVADFTVLTDGRRPDDIAEELAVWAKTAKQ